MLPSPRLLKIITALVAVALLPVLVDPSFVWVVAASWAIVLGAVVYDAWNLRAATPRVSATIPAAVGVGDSVAIDLRLATDASRPLRATVRAEPIAPLTAGADADVRLDRAVTERRIELGAPRRGTGGLAAAWVRTDGPLGVVRRIDRVALDHAGVAIVPNLGHVRRLALRHSASRQLPGAALLDRRAGAGTELDSLVAHVPGMDLRHVDWKASARHQAVRVRRFRLEQNQRLVLCIDTGRSMADPIHGIERLDHAVHAALLLSHVALRAGDLVGVHAYGARPVCFVPPASGPRHFQRIVQGCASLSARDEETNHVLGLRALLGRLDRRSLVVVLTELEDATTAELMIENLAHLAQRHLVVFVALDDPLTEAHDAVEPRTIDDVARAVVAGVLRRDRLRVLQRLGRAGVDVVHGPPDASALELLDRYIRIKRRGRIG